MKKIIYASALLTLATACGGSSGQTGAVATSPPAQASASATPTTSPTPKDLTAKQIVLNLVARQPAKMTIVYNESNDPNNLLGRPNGYVSKAAFKDSRIKAADVRDDSTGSVDVGGSVEVFSDASGARGRADYIQGIMKNNPMFGSEYDYLAGPVLLRVSGNLTPSQARGYSSDLASVTGAKVEGPVTA